MWNHNSVNSFTVDGISFYTTEEGCAIARAGLAKLVGKAENTVKELISNIEKGDKRTLQDLIDINVHNVYFGNPNALIIRGASAVKIIQYYAVKHDAKTAQAALSKFAYAGFDTWVKGLYLERDRNPNPNKEELRQIKNSIEALDRKIDSLKSYSNDRQATAKPTPVKSEMEVLWERSRANELIQQKIPISEPENFTLTEWVKLAHADTADFYDRNRYVKHRLAGIAAAAYKSRNSRPPNEDKRRDENGKLKNAVDVYTSIDFPLLEEAWQQMLRELSEQKSIQ